MEKKTEPNYFIIFTSNFSNRDGQLIGFAYYTVAVKLSNLCSYSLMYCTVCVGDTKIKWFVLFT